MRQVLRAGALGRPRGMGWRGRWEGGSGWGIHVNPWLIHVNVWQKPLRYCKVISLQLIKINGKKKRNLDLSDKKKSLLFRPTNLWYSYYGRLSKLKCVSNRANLPPPQWRWRPCGSNIEAQLSHLVLGHQKRTHRKPELPIPLNGNEKPFHRKVKKNTKFQQRNWKSWQKIDK